MPLEQRDDGRQATGAAAGSCLRIKQYTVLHRSISAHVTVLLVQARGVVDSCCVRNNRVAVAFNGSVAVTIRNRRAAVTIRNRRAAVTIRNRHAALTIRNRRAALP